MEFSFLVEYRPGRHSIVVDSLSHRDEDLSILMAISMLQLSLFDAIRHEQQQSSEIQQIFHLIINSTTTP